MRGFRTITRLTWLTVQILETLWDIKYKRLQVGGRVEENARCSGFYYDNDLQQRREKKNNKELF